jgi:hypothetical protein
MDLHRFLDGSLLVFTFSMQQAGCYGTANNFFPLKQFIIPAFLILYHPTEKTIGGTKYYSDNCIFTALKINEEISPDPAHVYFGNCFQFKITCAGKPAK